MKRLSVLRISYAKQGNAPAKITKVSDVIDIEDDYYRKLFSKQIHVDSPVLARTANMVILKPTSAYAGPLYMVFVYVIFDETHPLYNYGLLKSLIFEFDITTNNLQWRQASEKYVLNSNSFNDVIDSLIRSHADIDKAIERAAV